MIQPATILQLLEIGADEDTAIYAPQRPPLTYSLLGELALRTIDKLNGFGIGRNDRVAIVLPNGPEMATAFVTIACAATTAPLNPGYKQEEFEFYLDDLNARALVVEKGSNSPSVAAARKLGIDIVELVTDGSRYAGDFDLEASTKTSIATNGGQANTTDIALILHTSGTTSRPKIVPLSQANVCASATNIMDSLLLSSGDRCMNIMPLFHIHGLIAAVLASLRSGAAIYCTPGFNALKFFNWMEEAKPTWYTAVPTMHQAILSRANRSQKIISSNPLRFIRSSSASLPTQVMAELESTFHAPVIEAYGMTEASHQMASNPLPPAARKAGTVGQGGWPRSGDYGRKWTHY